MPPKKREELERIIEKLSAATLNESATEDAQQDDAFPMDVVDLSGGDSEISGAAADSVPGDKTETIVVDSANGPVYGRIDQHDDKTRNLDEPTERTAAILVGPADDTEELKAEILRLTNRQLHLLAERQRLQHDGEKLDNRRNALKLQEMLVDKRLRLARARLSAAEEQRERRAVSRALQQHLDLASRLGRTERPCRYASLVESGWSLPSASSSHTECAPDGKPLVPTRRRWAHPGAEPFPVATSSSIGMVQDSNPSSDEAYARRRLPLEQSTATSQEQQQQRPPQDRKKQKQKKKREEQEPRQPIREPHQNEPSPRVPDGGSSQPPPSMTNYLMASLTSAFSRMNPGTHDRHRSDGARSRTERNAGGTLEAFDRSSYLAMRPSSGFLRRVAPLQLPESVPPMERQRLQRLYEGLLRPELPLPVERPQLQQLLQGLQRPELMCEKCTSTIRTRRRSSGRVVCELCEESPNSQFIIGPSQVNQQQQASSPQTAQRSELGKSVAYRNPPKPACTFCDSPDTILYFNGLHLCYACDLARRQRGRIARSTRSPSKESSKKTSDKSKDPSRD